MSYKIPVLVKRLNTAGVLPEYQTELAAGFDLHAAVDIDLGPSDTKLIPTALAMSIPQGFELQIRPRSGLAMKYGVTVANSPGTIDSDYRGEIKVILKNESGRPFLIEKGMRIAQGVISPVFQAEWQEVSELDETERGTNGFGSTGL